MQSGRALLRAWITRSKQNQRALAETLAMSDGYLSQILSGVRRPKLETLQAIEDLTGVPLGSWVDTRRGKSDKRPKTIAK